MDEALSFEEWQASVPGAGNAARSNRDGDALDDLMEFALGTDPSSGATGRAPLQLVFDEAAGKLEAAFLRPPGRRGIVYQMEFSESLKGDSWEEVPTETVGLGGDARERVAATLSSTPEGFLRLRVIREDSGESSVAPPMGWRDTSFREGYQTFGPALRRPSVYQSTVRAISGTTVYLTAAGLTLGASEAHYLEVLDGVFEGHRFEIATGGGAVVALAEGRSRHSVFPIPDGLVGSRVAIRPHWSVRSLFSPDSFEGGPDLLDGDQLLFFESGRFEAMFLLEKQGEAPRWVSGEDLSLSDQGDRVLAPEASCFVLTHGGDGRRVRVIGEPRRHAGWLTLSEEISLISPESALAVSPGALGWLAETELRADRAPVNADQFMIWQGDREAAQEGYDLWFLMENAPGERQWTREGDESLQNETNRVVLEPDRALFFRWPPGSPVLTLPLRSSLRDD